MQELVERPEVISRVFSAVNIRTFVLRAASLQGLMLVPCIQFSPCMGISASMKPRR